MKCDYYHVVTEKQGSQRHVHAGIVLKQPTTKSNLGVMVKRLFKDFDTAEQRVLLQGVKIMYNMDFIDHYLNKDDDTVVISTCLPEAGHMEKYFPPKPNTDAVRTKKCSAYYHELEHLWYEHKQPHEEVNTMCVRDFLFKMMYSLRIIPVIRDDKTIIQTARHLCRWLNKSETSTIELPPFEKEE